MGYQQLPEQSGLTTWKTWLLYACCVCILCLNEVSLPSCINRSVQTVIDRGMQEISTLRKCKASLSSSSVFLGESINGTVKKQKFEGATAEQRS